MNDSGRHFLAPRICQEGVGRVGISYHPASVISEISEESDCEVLVTLLLRESFREYYSISWQHSVSRALAAALIIRAGYTCSMDYFAVNHIKPCYVHGLTRHHTTDANSAGAPAWRCVYGLDLVAERFFI